MSADSTPEAIAQAILHPTTQTFTLYDSLGDKFTVSMQDVAIYVYNGVSQSIVLASQVGAALAVLIVLAMLTKAEKRRLPVFILNTLALLLTVIDQILYCLYYTGPWYNPYAYLSGDYSFVPHSSKAISAAAEILAFFVELCLESSLVLQVYVVCATLHRVKRAAVMMITAIVALLAIGFRLAQVILNVKINIIEEKPNLDIAWVAKARDITLTVSICFFSAIFCLKLGWAMRQRRLLGLQQFGPMQIIFIGGTQTLIIPGTSKLTTITITHTNSPSQSSAPSSNSSVPPSEQVASS